MLFDPQTSSYRLLQLYVTHWGVALLSKIQVGRGSRNFSNASLFSKLIITREVMITNKIATIISISYQLLIDTRKH